MRLLPTSYDLKLLKFCLLLTEVNPLEIMVFKNIAGDFPGGPVVKNPPSSAGDPGLIPGQGTRIPHAAGQLSPRTTTTEPECLN